MLHVRTLGALRQVSDGDGRPLRRKPLALLAYLARRAPRPVTRTELATLLWGERGEERARQSLRQALVELKHALGDKIDINAEFVRLTADAVELDIVAFERDMSAGRVQEAAERWAGDFLEGAEDVGGDGFRRWIENERVALHEQLGVAMGRLIGDAELRGDGRAAADWAQRWAAALPFDETANLRLIESLRTSGRSGDVLKTHAAFVTRVRTAFDAEPSAEFLRVSGGLADDARAELARRGRKSAALRGPSLAGRVAIIRELVDAWQLASAGTPAVVLVEGAAGSGLTRICDELAAHAGAEAVVLRGRGAGATTDYSTAAELFQGVRNAAGSAGAAPEALAEVARLVPSLAAQFRHLPPPVGDDAALLDGLAQTLGAIGDEQPVLVVLDDLHAADEASRRLVASLAPRLTGRVMLLLATDAAERELGPAHAALLGTRNLQVLRLQELAPGDVETMLGSMVTLEPIDRQALAARLHQESGGLPHDVREIVTSLVDEHLLTLDSGGTWRVSPSLAGRVLPVPPSVRERVRARLERLSPPARSIADALAVLGAPTEVAMAEAVAGVTSDEAEAAFRELAARGVARESKAEPGRFELASPLLTHAAAALVPPTKRQRLHAHAVEVLGARDRSPSAERTVSPHGPDHAAPHVPAVARSRVRGPVWLAAAVVGVAAVAAIAMRGELPFGASRAEAAGAIVALGRITDYRGNVAEDFAKPLTDMLATNLGRVARLRVVSTARMYELVGQGSSGDDTSAASLMRAARRAGATELVDGALYARDDGGFQLDLRRVKLSSGNIEQTYSVKGGTLFELADSGTARLAADFGERTPVGSIADVTTRSVTAYRLYEQGLRAYYANDMRAAEPLFEAALREDSTFAMAAYYSAQSVLENPQLLLTRFALAARLAARTSDRERLTILARFAFLSSSPALLAIAETLVVRYPDEVDGYYFTGLGLMLDGQFLRGVAPLNRAVAMDSVGLSGASARCSACEALRQIVSLYQLADSLPAAEREARRWIRLRPTSPVPWHILADVLTQSGRHDEAFAALDREAALDVGRRDDLRLLNIAVRRAQAGEFEQANRLMEGELETGSRYRTALALWYRALSYRQQGRLNEAFADMRRYREMGGPTGPVAGPGRRQVVPLAGLSLAQILFEMGRYREAASLWDSVSTWTVRDASPSQRSHERAWSMAHAAGALVAAGDTTGLAARVDSIEAIGAGSGLGRDRRLHHYVRGLLLAARGQDTAAVPEFRKAIYSWNFGYTRTNVALATSLMRLRQPREAVAVLQPALRGPMEASNYYVTRTEIHELLGQAWDAVGDAPARDSAASHFAAVTRAWSRADTTFAARVRYAQARLAALTGRR